MNKQKRLYFILAIFALVPIIYWVTNTKSERDDFEKIFGMPYPINDTDKLFLLSRVDSIIDQRWQKVGVIGKELERLRQEVLHLPPLNPMDSSYATQKISNLLVIEKYQSILNDYNLLQREHAEAYASAYNAGYRKGPEKRVLQDDHHLVLTD